MPKLSDDCALEFDGLLDDTPARCKTMSACATRSKKHTCSCCQSFGTTSDRLPPSRKLEDKQNHWLAAARDRRQTKKDAYPTPAVLWSLPYRKSPKEAPEQLEATAMWQPP